MMSLHPPEIIFLVMKRWWDTGSCPYQDTYIHYIHLHTECKHTSISHILHIRFFPSVAFQIPKSWRYQEFSMINQSWRQDTDDGKHRQSSIVDLSYQAFSLLLWILRSSASEGEKPTRTRHHWRGKSLKTTTAKWVISWSLRLVDKITGWKYALFHKKIDTCRTFMVDRCSWVAKGRSFSAEWHSNKTRRVSN